MLENKRVVKPQKDVKEVMNAITIYNNLEGLKSTDEKSFLKAHKILLSNLIKDSGK